MPKPQNPLLCTLFFYSDILACDSKFAPPAAYHDEPTPDTAVVDENAPKLAFSSAEFMNIQLIFTKHFLQEPGEGLLLVCKQSGFQIVSRLLSRIVCVLRGKESFEAALLIISELRFPSPCSARRNVNVS